MALSFCIPTRSEWEFLFHFLPAVVVVSVLYFVLSNRCTVIPCFNVHILDDIWWDIFSYAFLPSVCLSSLPKYLFKVYFLKIFIWLLQVWRVGSLIFIAAGAIFSYGMWDLSVVTCKFHAMLQLVMFSSLTRDWT